MPTGQKKGQVHEVFKKRLENLQENAGKNYKGQKFEDQRVWDIPKDLGAQHLFEIAKLHDTSFDRSEMNANYVTCLADGKNPGTCGDTISLTMQVDYNAAEERAFRSRHASPVRCMAHAAARTRGRDVGPTFSRIEEDAANSLAAGAG